MDIAYEYYIIICLCAALVASVYFAIKFGMIILRMQDAIENSLEKLDESYASISETLQTPLFFDNAQVKKVLSDIEASRNAVLYVAGQLASIEQVEEADEEENI
tara:strand:- start:5 stop:316 length:312 start_codon:yes stop_codon:yes gene_type:complete